MKNLPGTDTCSTNIGDDQSFLTLTPALQIPAGILLHHADAGAAAVVAVATDVAAVVADLVSDLAVVFAGEVASGCLVADAL